MSPLFAPVLSGVISLIVTLGCGYYVLHSSHHKKQLLNPLPLLAGLFSGFLVLALMNHTFLPDRFHTASSALQILATMTAACLVLWSVDLFVPKEKTAMRAIAHLTSQLLAACLVVGAGMRFDLLKVPGEGVTHLGQWSSILTVAWLIMATNVVRLLDGIHGAAGVAVLIAGLAGLYSNILYKEFFLTGFSLVAVGCVAGSLRFCMSEKRLPLEGSGTAIIGFLFASLTVLARQKTIATLLLLIPVVLVILIAGAAMLGLLEKKLLLSRKDGHEAEPINTDGKDQ